MADNRQLNPEQQKVLDKIKKLLALATSPNEHEARLAAARANELLIRYNLSHQDVERHDSDYQSYEIPTSRRVYRCIEEKWVGPILESHFFVVIYSERHWGLHNNGTICKDGGSAYTSMNLVGTRVNVEIAIYVRDFLITKFRDLWRQFQEDHDGEVCSEEKYRQEYYRGLSDGLDKKLSATRVRVQEETGLVLVRDSVLHRVVKQMKLVKVRGLTGSRDDDVYDVGVDHGEQIEINKGVENKHQGAVLKLAHKK